ncbi:MULTISPECIES: DUF4421 family protein [Halobacteriovorax]|uniref:DUF4421 family protein n=1 Tax=Halobacteriovorax TaxID=1652133 RepID=UPI000EB6F412|nr:MULTISPECIES: DUF4421 family protein [Halobacteriovorax]AYF43629.1 hypothetical protein BALOs_0617 [Halobacteriovorax sp. BALOs_7]
MVGIVFALAIITAIWGDQIHPPKKLIESVEYSLDFASLNHTLEVADEVIEYQPTGLSYSSIRLSHKDFTIGVSLQNPISEEDKTKSKGESNATDIQLSSTWGRVYYELFYQDYKGYKIEGSDDGIRSNISSLNYGVTAVYFFNKSFRPATLFGHTEKNRSPQKSSIIEVNISDVKFESNESLIPTELQPKFSGFGEVTRVDATQYALSYGYTRQFQLSNFYLLLKGTIGLNISDLKFKNSNLKDDVTIGTAIGIGGDIGYEFDQSLFGIMINSKRLSNTSDYNTYSQIRSFGSLYYRFFF